jgi:phospholipase/carboxylesterase
VVLLHGYGADGNDLIGLAPVLAPLMPDAVFHAPNAPYPCEAQPDGLSSGSASRASIPRSLAAAGVRSAAPFVEHVPRRHDGEVRARREPRPSSIGFSARAP